LTTFWITSKICWISLIPLW